MPLFDDLLSGGIGSTQPSQQQVATVPIDINTIFRDDEHQIQQGNVATIGTAPTLPTIGSITNDLFTDQFTIESPGGTQIGGTGGLGAPVGTTPLSGADRAEVQRAGVSTGGLDSQRQSLPAASNGWENGYRSSGVSHTGATLAPYAGYSYDSDYVGYIDAIAKMFPEMRVASGYRSPTHNSNVGGVSNSWHLRARAADFSRNDLPEAQEEVVLNQYAQQIKERFGGDVSTLVHGGVGNVHLHVSLVGQPWSGR